MAGKHSYIPSIVPLVSVELSLELGHDVGQLPIVRELGSRNRIHVERAGTGDGDQGVRAYNKSLTSPRHTRGVKESKGQETQSTENQAILLHCRLGGAEKRISMVATRSRREPAQSRRSTIFLYGGRKHRGRSAVEEREERERQDTDRR